MPKELNKNEVIGKKFNMLTVVDMYKKKTDEKSRNRWYCMTKCDCGNTREVLYDYMIAKSKSISCGCSRYEKGNNIASQEMLGRVFGKLTVVEMDKDRYFKDLNDFKTGKTVSLQRYWICGCECGGVVSIATGTLTSGHTQSCGCYQRKMASKHNGEDLSGMMFGYLTVVGKDEELSNVVKSEGDRNVKRTWWKCKCKCGNTISTRAKYLKQNETTSCGCRSTSAIQEEVEKYIISKGYSINKEYDCTIIPKNPKTGYYLPFDIEIKGLRLIIEVHGIQHYELCGIHKMKATTVHTTPDENFKYQRLKDRYKSYIAFISGYRYLEISYSDVDNGHFREIIDNFI